MFREPRRWRSTSTAAALLMLCKPRAKCVCISRFIVCSILVASRVDAGAHQPRPALLNLNTALLQPTQPARMAHCTYIIGSCVNDARQILLVPWALQHLFSRRGRVESRMLCSCLTAKSAMAQVLRGQNNSTKNSKTETDKLLWANAREVTI